MRRSQRDGPRAELRVAQGNAASLRVAQKAGFVREGFARCAGCFHDDERLDLAGHSLTRADVGHPESAH